MAMIRVKVKVMDQGGLNRKMVMVTSMVKASMSMT